MGQREKARQLVDSEYEFTLESKRSTAEVRRLANEAAEQSKRVMSGSIRPDGERKGSSGRQLLDFSVRGPGGLMEIMDFTVAVSERDTGSQVQLVVGDFLFQKGSLGMKPRVNAAPLMSKFVTLFRGALR